jgi:hypothetical protein
MPQDHFKGCEFALKFIAPVVEVVPLQQFSFRGFGPTQTLRGKLSLYYFCQGELMDFVEHKNLATKDWQERLIRMDDS